MNPEVRLSNESIEKKGTNVEVLIKFMRHGERDKVGNLKELGREITKQKARESGITAGKFDAVKAIGSDAGPKNNLKMGRSLETAHIYANAIEGDEAFRSRSQRELNYENIKSPIPYDHIAIYNSFLPANFEDLNDEDTIKAAKAAQRAVVDYSLSLSTPEAEVFRNEVAGAHAYTIEHYKMLAQRMNPESKVLIPAGTHGGLMEFLLQKALVRKGKDGEEMIGFSKSSDIGGEFNPSEAFNVDIRTGENGDFLPLKVTFDNPERPNQEMYLDDVVVKELAEYYKQIHNID